MEPNLGQRPGADNLSCKKDKPVQQFVLALLETTFQGRSLKETDNLTHKPSIYTAQIHSYSQEVTRGQ